MRNAPMLLILLALIAIVSVSIVGGCSDADVASSNISKAADQFEIVRRIVFYNSIQDVYLLEIEGLCSLGNYDQTGEISVTCKIGPDTYVKHYLGLSNNVTYVAEQIDAAKVSPYHYRVVFKPAAILPYIDIEP